MNYSDYIEINNEVRFGKPVIKGTRISVSDILEMLSNGMAINDILEDFPQLTEIQIKMCLKYASQRENNIVIAL
jgi:uncharacterized protein (DUF433 family)